MISINEIQEDVCMRKQWIALAAALCLLLSGCGGTGTVSSAPEPTSGSAASVQHETSAAEAETSAPAPQENSSQELSDPGDLSPEELGHWAWAQMEAYNDSAYAIDYDMDMSVSITLDDESTSEKLTGRIKSIQSEADGETAYASIQTAGEVTETWYGGGYVYLSDSTGKYKAPYDEDAQQAEQNGASDLLEIDADNFGTLTAEATDKGYTVTFADPTLDTWMAFSDMLSAAGDGVTCTGFGLSGTVEMGQDGALRNLDMELSAEFDIMGMTMTETLTMTQDVNGYDDSVSIHVPETDAEFKEISDISLPTAFIDGYNTLLSQYALTYQGDLELTVSDGSSTDTYGQTDDFSFIYYEDGLVAVWNRVLAQNGETVDYFNEHYANGQLDRIGPDGETNGTYSEDDYLSDVDSFLAYYSDSFDYGDHFTLQQDGEYQVLTYDVDSIYVEAVTAGNLSSLDSVIDPDEASSVTASGTLSFWFDLSGMLVRQEFSGTVEYQFSGAVFTVTITDTGTVLAVNDSVTVDAGA